MPLIDPNQKALAVAAEHLGKLLEQAANAHELEDAPRRDVWRQLEEAAMSELELVDGCPVLGKSRSKDPRFAWVVLCELPEPEDGFGEDAHRYVVWYVDQHGTTLVGSYQQTHDTARTVFRIRTI